MPQQVTPYVLYEDTNAAIDWLTSAFGFTEVLRYEDDGVVTHAELELEGHHWFFATQLEEKAPEDWGATKKA